MFNIYTFTYIQLILFITFVVLFTIFLDNLYLRKHLGINYSKFYKITKMIYSFRNLIGKEYKFSDEDFMNVFKDYLRSKLGDDFTDDNFI